MQKEKEGIPLDKHFDNIVLVSSIGKKLHISSTLAALSIIGISFLSVFFGYFELFLVAFIGITYPAYMSLRGINKKEYADKKQWLTYWIIFAIYSLIDNLKENFSLWIPFYYSIKMVVLVYLFWPQTKGATLIYDKYLRPRTESIKPHN